MRPLPAILSAVALISSTVIADTAAQDIRNTLHGLDGVFSEEERSAATHSVVTTGNSIYAQLDDSLLRVTVHSEPIGVASLCVGGDQAVHVLHASAALGSLRYERDGEDWLTGDSFEWKMRDTTLSEEAITQRAAYFDAHGWVATTSSMGDAETVEFMVSTDLAGTDGAYLAVGIMPSERPDSILGVPDDAGGDCANGELVRGSRPDGALDFPTGKWMRIGW